MKAFVATGDPAALIRQTEVGEPVQRPDEALVKVDAYSVNRGEIFQLEQSAEGARPGKDIAGLVVQAAPDGSGPQVGQRVVGHPSSSGWAEFVAVPVGGLALLPASVTAVQAAALPLAGLTALRLLRTAGCVAGRRILLTGASGGVGHYFTELAAAAGASVTAVSASAERGERLAALGAAAVVPEVDDAQGTFDLVLESTGGKNLPSALCRLAPRGQLVWFGQASREPAVLDFFDFFAGPVSATVRHFSYADVDEPDAADLETLVRLVAEDRLHPELGRTADWQHTPGVLADLRDRRIRGNAVLSIS
ncbi:MULTISPECIES: zinc-binding dehydrogenase [unclassified Kitasatospora]|uniref:zinc-binding dehydrogenase n=1 Tax=unclassified Kitasatospora TaxID=2633591 RepID=UPI000708A591|nr:MULTISPECIES: zinc-binding dehydrogenase [unclassified Kitasatospora]KQV18758.1 alcohol dehydrogenase [Kitasatospora sp. Root107]KRB74739.1 alcohol dehydrogenase [Kitasatospora sp. Root187]